MAWVIALRSNLLLRISFFVFTALVFFAGGLVASRQLEGTLLGQVRHELERTTQLLEEVAKNREPADALADELGQLADVRVTLVGASGKVLGDSAVASALLDRLDNHQERPEIVVAHQGHSGFAVRESKTVGERMAYFAQPLGRDAVLRTGRSLRDVDSVLFRLHLLVAFGALAAMGLIIVALSSADKQKVILLGQVSEAVRATRVQAETVLELGEEKKRFERILEGMQEGVLVVDDDAHITLINRALREMLLLSNEVLGKPLIEAIRNADLQATVDRARADNAPQATELETAGLKPRILLAQASPLPGYGQVIVFVDVTDIRRLESLRRDFVANVSHELRTPVTAIRSAAETLKTSALQEPKAAATFVDMVDRNAERLGALVEDLLDLSRIEGKAYKLTLEALNVATVANYSLSLFRERAEKKKLVLKAQVESEISGVRADRRALEQVLTNLIDNAVKYCPEGASITVAAQSSERNIRISVIDTGRGIEQKHLPRLFERFYRVDAGRGRDTGGTGLGLSIAKHLIEAMGGSISVESAQGQGTAFHIELVRA